MIMHCVLEHCLIVDQLMFLFYWHLILCILLLISKHDLFINPKYFIIFYINAQFLSFMCGIVI